MPSEIFAGGTNGDPRALREALRQALTAFIDRLNQAGGRAESIIAEKTDEVSEIYGRENDSIVDPKIHI